MILHIRPRGEASDETAKQIAEKYSAPVLSVPFLYDLPPTDPVIDRLRQETEPFTILSPISARATIALLDTLGIQTPVQACVGTIEELGALPTNSAEYRFICGSFSNRWYPVIDRAACTGCLECVNFCLFGVYAIGADAKPFTDNPDACRDGCPACSRVCPSGAILFPLYDDPAINGHLTAEEVKAKQQNQKPAEADDLDRLIDQTDAL